MDYESLLSVLIKHKKSNLLFKFLENSHLKKKFRRQAVVQGFRESMRREELAIATMIWSKNSKFMQEDADDIVESVVQAIERSPALLAIKTYFLLLLIEEISYA